MEGETNILNMARRQNQILRARGRGAREPTAKSGDKTDQERGGQEGKTKESRE